MSVEGGKEGYLRGGGGGERERFERVRHGYVRGVISTWHETTFAT